MDRQSRARWADLLRLARDPLVQANRSLRWVIIVSNVLGTGLLGVGSALVSYAEDTKVLGVTLVGIGVFVVGVAQVLTALTVTTNSGVLVLAEGAVAAHDRARELLDALQERYARATEALERLALISAIGRAQRELVEEAVESPSTSVEKRDATMGYMLDLVLRDVRRLCGIDGDAYSFSIYIPNEAGDRLVPVVNRRPVRSQEQQANSVIDVSFGIIGYAFKKNREYVTGDTTRDQVFEARPERSDDHLRYRSVAAIPIALSADGTRPSGVLVASTDIKDRFVGGSVDYVEPLRVLASMLAIYLAVIQVSDPKENPNEPHER